MLIHQDVIKEEDITAFLSAQEALDTLLKCKEEELPEIMLLDLAMPFLDGWKVFEELTPFRSKFE